MTRKLSTKKQESDDTKNDEGFKRFMEFVKEFEKETDRAAVILAAAKLDIQLFQILQAVLKPSTSRTDDLLEGDSPLGTFSSRIIMCHRLGLIDEEFTRSLNLIRKIRNSFAHEALGANLNSGSHADRIKELAAPFKRHEIFDGFSESYFSSKKTLDAEFRIVVAMLSLRLEDIFNSCKSIYSDSSYGIIPPHLMDNPN